MNIIDELDPSTPVTTKVLALSLHVLASRALVWIAFAGATALWTMTMLDPSVLKLVTATGYCVFALGPILLRDARGGG